MMEQRVMSLMVLFVVAGILLVCEAFVTSSVSSRTVRNSPAVFGLQSPSPRWTRLYAEESEEEATAEVAKEEEEKVEPPEDPEVKAIKEEIASLETQLKSKQREVQQANDKADEYTETGYARKVASMENMRKLRRELQSSNAFTSTATVVQNFLPVLDELRSLKETYGKDEFGKNYAALPGNFQGALKELDVEEFTVEVGDKVDVRRMSVIESEYSDKFEKGTVIRPLTMGMELQGNVMRMAECVASLGSEAEAKKAEEAAAAASEESSDEAAGEESSSEGEE